MHELYHHLQHLNGDSGKDKCSADVEIPAYKVQTAYLKIELDEWIGDVVNRSLRTNGNHNPG